ncbi:MAG TPA: acyl-ACP--UDP-N-acetylglucosamine O-acyltransferase [Chthoniobacterales bacterium]|nr:acyl-ACP--UDP-N-acetylglucosamine O-acyltransferase [Chthoniobacterales bacterium]
MKIHPAAIVDPGARIGPDVEIGPYAIVGSGAVIGERCTIQAHAIIEGAVKMGADNFVGYGAVIGAMPQDLSFDPKTASSVVIGDANVIREYCTIHRGSTEGSATVIGDRNFLMVGTHLGHNCMIGNRVVIANDCLLAGHVRIDDQAFIGGGSRFHQGIRMGRLVMAEGRFTQNLPPFLGAAKNEVYGMNIVGMRRANFTADERDEIKRAFKLLYRSGLNTKQALEKAAAAEFGPVGREFFEFVADAGKRGIVRYGRGALED